MYALIWLAPDISDEIQIWNVSGALVDMFLILRNRTHHNSDLAWNRLENNPGHVGG